MKKRFCYLLLIIGVLCMLSGCGKSNSLVGKWENEKETLEFKSNGKFSALFYWPGGEYSVEENKITLRSNLIGNVSYYYRIEDDILCFYSDEKMEMLRHAFVKYGEDLSLLEEFIEKKREEAEMQDNSKDEEVNEPELEASEAINSEAINSEESMKEEEETVKQEAEENLTKDNLKIENVYVGTGNQTEDLNFNIAGESHFKTDSAIINYTINGVERQITYQGYYIDGYGCEMGYQVADVNNDGREDLIVSVYCIGNTLHELLQDTYIYSIDDKTEDLVEVLRIPSSGEAVNYLNYSFNVGVYAEDGGLRLDDCEDNMTDISIKSVHLNYDTYTWTQE